MEQFEIENEEVFAIVHNNPSRKVNISDTLKFEVKVGNNNG